MELKKVNPQDILNGHAEASEHFNNLYTPKTLAKYACTGEKNIPMHKIGRKVVYLKSELNAWLPLNAITSIERKSMLGHQTVRLHTSHDALSFKTFKKEEETALVQAIEKGRNLTTVKISQPTNHIESIRQLSELRSAGILTEEEFLTKKTELLAKL